MRRNILIVIAVSTGVVLAADARRHARPAIADATETAAALPCSPDTGAPVLRCPDDSAGVYAPECSYIPELPRAVDACDPTPRVVAFPAVVKGEGETAVTFVATDASGNTAACVVHYRLACDHCASAPADLVAWWPLDVAADGATIPDRIGGNDGTAYNGPTIVHGHTDGALHFDGSDQLVRAPAQRVHNYLNLTLDAWIKPERTDRPMEIIALQSGIYGFFVQGGELRFRVAALPLWYTFASTGAQLEPGQWTHVAVVADRGTGQVSFYVNGELVSSSEPVYSALNIFAGTEWILGDGPDGAFAGDLDEVHVFERALAAEDIRGIYEAGNAGLCFQPLEAAAASSAP